MICHIFESEEVSCGFHVLFFLIGPGVPTSSRDKKVRGCPFSFLSFIFFIRGNRVHGLLPRV
jgi:hypothetical protein